MKTRVNELVNKEWAASAKTILTRNSQDITSLFTELRTLTLNHDSSLKSQAAKDRLATGFSLVTDTLRYAWACAFNDQQIRLTLPAKNIATRRVGALLPLAIKAGETIGKAQAAKINHAHRNADSKGLGMHHEHATPAS